MRNWQAHSCIQETYEKKTKGILNFGIKGPISCVDMSLKKQINQKSLPKGCLSLKHICVIYRLWLFYIAAFIIPVCIGIISFMSSGKTIVDSHDDDDDDVCFLNLFLDEHLNNSLNFLMSFLGIWQWSQN